MAGMCWTSCWVADPKGENNMKKQRGFLLVVAVLAAILLCGCSQYDDKYEDNAFLTDTANHYAAILWTGYTQTDKSYALSAGSFSGVNTLRSFMVEEDGTLCEVTSTLAGHKGEAKLLVVNAVDRTLVAQWPLDSGDSMTVTLPAGWYELRIAGKSAGFEGEVGLMLNGQPVTWDGVWDTIEEMLTGSWESATVESTAKQ